MKGFLLRDSDHDTRCSLGHGTCFWEDLRAALLLVERFVRHKAIDNWICGRTLYGCGAVFDADLLGSKKSDMLCTFFLSQQCVEKWVLSTKPWLWGHGTLL